MRGDLAMQAWFLDCHIPGLDPNEPYTLNPSGYRTNLFCCACSHALDTVDDRLPLLGLPHAFAHRLGPRSTLALEARDRAQDFGRCHGVLLCVPAGLPPSSVRMHRSRWWR